MHTRCTSACRLPFLPAHASLAFFSLNAVADKLRQKKRQLGREGRGLGRNLLLTYNDAYVIARAAAGQHPCQSSS